MDYLIEKLINSFTGYINAEKDLTECVNGCEYDSGYFCQSKYDVVEEYKEDIKKIIIKLIKEGLKND